MCLSTPQLLSMGRGTPGRRRLSASFITAAAAPAEVQQAEELYDLQCARAFWVNADILLLPAPAPGLSYIVTLCSSDAADLSASQQEGVVSVHFPERATRHELQPTTVPPEVFTRSPYLSLLGLAAFRLDADKPTRLALLKSQLVVEARRRDDGQVVVVTGVQTAGALDALCSYDGPLGIQLLPHGSATLRVWAPTAQSVKVRVYDTPRDGAESREEHSMGADSRGVWSITLPRLLGRWVTYVVTAFHPSTNAVETCEVTDPYARALAANGGRVCVADIEHVSLVPPDWNTLRDRKPRLAHHGDSVLYELHVRDFSASDTSVPPALRGKFEAFTVESQGTRHLAALARCGVTHVHLLPCYDFGSVDEMPANWKQAIAADGQSLESLPADSEMQQAAVMAVADADAYNWGYDPVHFGVPDGSYCVQPDGPQRSLEFRRCVSALNTVGLRVVVDVVYNHVFGSGPHNRFAVLDKIVPGYYLRRDEAGRVCASTCMNNTASEHVMCERLIVDDALHWATSYKVDGFRFDLMGHLMKRTLLRIRQALDAGGMGDVIMYGEGWDYAEVEAGLRGPNGSQLGVRGTGIGTFNDRIREAAIGANPFGDPRLQGLLTGLYTQPWPGAQQGTVEQQRQQLARFTERVIAGIAGNLAAYTFTGKDGTPIAGYDAGGVGSCCGYAEQPHESINYVSAHDNETLWDLVALKLPPHAGADVRTRVVGLAQALLCWSQGIPFLHAGDELLRSKSLDRDSYNSGDWFNVLDWSGQITGWGRGLPPAPKNQGAWPIQRALLADAAGGAPTPAHVASAWAHLQRVLTVRTSSPLFRLRTCKDVQLRLHFHNRGEDEVPGVLCWELIDAEPQLDINFAGILCVINATPHLHQVAATNRAWQLHPALAPDASAHAAAVVDGTVTVPPYTAAAFVFKR